MREQRIEFVKAEPADNPTAPLFMIELRSVPTSFTNNIGQYQGEVRLTGDESMRKRVEKFMIDTFQCSPGWITKAADVVLRIDCLRLENHQGDIFWQGRLNGRSNFGFVYLKIVDFIVDHCGWELIVCNSNSVDTTFKVHASHWNKSVNGRETQMVFQQRSAGV